MTPPFGVPPLPLQSVTQAPTGGEASPKRRNRKDDKSPKDGDGDL